MQFILSLLGSGVALFKLLCQLIELVKAVWTIFNGHRKTEAPVAQKIKAASVDVKEATVAAIKPTETLKVEGSHMDKIDDIMNSEDFKNIRETGSSSVGVPDYLQKYEDHK